MKTLLERFEQKFIPEPNSGCWLWTGSLDRKGYGRILVKGTNQKASRVAFILFVGEIPDGMFVCHRCDVRLCVNPKHLFLGTAADNAADMAAKGRSAKNNRKLNSDQVLEIRQLLSEFGYRTISRKFGMHRSTIRDIARRVIWKTND